ncbi:MAG: MarR family winged helix-turn-helix transcriptional regulator [Gammaproteobacteria bacterium]
MTNIEIADRLENEHHLAQRCYMDAVNIAYKLVDSAKKQLNSHLRKYNIKFTHWYLLKSILFDAADTPSALALCMGTDRAAITRLLDDLEARNLINRIRSKQDRRVVRIALTDDGISLIEKGTDGLDKLPELLKERLDSNQIDKLRCFEQNFFNQ